ncbi:hypothetical protein [Saccharothrix sp. NRRL B-16348]|uniref:hypothetical protein n=1 Tax=Saccharothrix sp. NRRL B-16348 TaxID=1415542 RepID=UPI000ADC2A3E|nr:hypothetical protein [Saccharothrix sp. NRRL B-16348]
MGPDDWLREIREIFNQHSQGNPVDLDRLAQVWEDLDTWLVRGGFPPAPWWHRT